MEQIEFCGRKFAAIPGIESRLHDFVSHFQSRDDDIWICAYMKCGSHWVNDILQILCHPGEHQDNQMKEKLFVEVTHHSKWLNYPSPRILNTHMPYPLLPQSVKNCKIIWCVRNTKDVAVSSFNHFKNISPTEMLSSWTWDEYIENFTQIEPDYFNYHNEWFDLLKEQPKNILQVNYEDMKEDTVKMVKQIVNFLKLDFITDEQIRAVVLETSLDKMIQKHANDEIILKDDTREIKGFPGKLYRKGIIGDWRNWFTEEQNDSFNKLYEDSVQGRCYGFENYMDL